MLRSALGVDVLLTVVGGVFLLFLGAALWSDGTAVVRPVLAVGFLVPFAVAAAAQRTRDRLAGLEEWFGNTRRGRAVYLAILLTILGSRVALGFAPDPVQDAVFVGAFGLAGGMVVLALVRGLGRVSGAS